MYDILIVGGSFSGLTTALAVAKTNHNLKIALLEKNDIIKQDRKRDGRVFAISKSSTTLFKEIGIWEGLEKIAGKILDIRITDGNSPFYLHFNGLEVSQTSPCMGAVIENFYIHNALRNQVLKQKNIDLICPHFYKNIEFFEDKVVASLDNKKKIEAKLLVAADGRMSPLRSKFNIGVFEKSYGQAAIVFNIKHSKPHNNIAQEKFLPQGPFAILPMKDSKESSIVWTVKADIADVIMGLDKKNFLQQLTKHTTDYLGKIKVTNQPFKYNLSLVLADNYYYQRMILIGDAAHAIHPIAGQGFNLGIGDIKLLCDLIAEYSKCGLDIGSITLLDKYQKLRKIASTKMILATDSLNSLFSNKILPVKWIRDLGLGMVEKLPKLKKFFIKSAGGNDGEE